MAGIQNLKEVVLFGCEIVNGIVKSYEDEHLDWKDIINFAPAAKAAIPAIKDVGEIPAEFEDLDEAERKELTDYVSEKFDIPDDRVEEFVEKAFRVGIQIVDLVQDGMEIFGKSES